MDIFARNFPHSANHVEVRRFLKDKLLKFNILCFDVVKKQGFDWAIITIADESKAQNVLTLFGGQNLMPLVFDGRPLTLKRSNRRGQPDALKVRALLDAEQDLATKLSATGHVGQSDRHLSIYPVASLATGVWTYDRLGNLTFDQKYLDSRPGTITFGRTGLVIYLQKNSESESWHGRIDIHYGIIEHAVASNANRHPMIFLTLRTPPKMYELVNEESLHLYSGGQRPQPAFIPGMLALSLTEIDKKMRRRCRLNGQLEHNSALCMVYGVSFPNLDQARQAWQFIKHCSPTKQKDVFRDNVPSVLSRKVEEDYSNLQRQLDNAAKYRSLHFDCRFQLLAIVHEGTLTPATVASLLGFLNAMAKEHGSVNVASAIRKLALQFPTPGPSIDAQQFTSHAILNSVRFHLGSAKETSDGLGNSVDWQKDKGHLVQTYKAIITPTGLLLRGPDLIASNRVLRKYAGFHEYFMRVSFTDEDGFPVSYDGRTSQKEVYDRFKKVLEDGININGRTYEFLGFSHSSLHYHTAWFLSPFFSQERQITAKNVIKDLGDFTRFEVAAKCAARIGQTFSDTLFAVRLPDHALIKQKERDIKRNGRCFSDGCGTISHALLRRVWKALPPGRAAQRPTILQVRFRGAKGVVSLDRSLPGEQLLIRESMTKFDTAESWRDLEICGAAYRPLMMFLNHQFIKILEDLGVPHASFIGAQDDALRTLKMIVGHQVNAAKFLEYSHTATAARMPTLLRLLNEIGLLYHADHFLTDIVQIAAIASLRDLKYRARIPIEAGRLLYGIVDETNELREGEVYVAIREVCQNGEYRRTVIVQDRVVVTRAPALHPGDIQIVRAVDKPDNTFLKGQHNCVVFSQQGARDLPSQLGGGDLDGDLFHIIWDKRLIPSWTEASADYAPAQAKKLGRPVQRDDIIDFFIEYMHSDRLGQISNMHKMRADILPEGTRHDGCKILAELASVAVDFTKTGIPVDMSRIPKGTSTMKPDFMSSAPSMMLDHENVKLQALDEDDVDDPDSIALLDPDRYKPRYYRSQKILGVLYRKIDEQKFFTAMNDDIRAARQSMNYEDLIGKLEKYADQETRGWQWDHHRAFAEKLRELYEDNILDIMDSLRSHRGKPLKEIEVFSGNILGKNNRDMSKHAREANQEVRERFNRDVGSIVHKIIHGDKEGDEEEALPRAYACFKVGLETEGWENTVQLRSFKYVAAAIFLEQLWFKNDYKLRPL